MIEGNFDETLEKLNALDRSDLDAFVLEYNSLLSQIVEFSAATCETPCEQCFVPIGNSGDATELCGLFSTENTLDAKSQPANYTLEDIINGTETTFQDLIVGTSNSGFCIQYTRNQFSNSEVCVTYINEVVAESDLLFCNVTFNGVLCSSCTISADGDECLIADCSNVDSMYGTMLDSCQKTGVDGPFQIVFLLDEADNKTFTEGSCDVDVPEPTPSAPAKSPATAPSKNNAPTSNGDGSASIFPLTYIALAITSIAMFRNLN